MNPWKISYILFVFIVLISIVKLRIDIEKRLKHDEYIIEKHFNDMLNLQAEQQKSFYWLEKEVFTETKELKALIK